MKAAEYAAQINAVVAAHGADSQEASQAAWDALRGLMDETGALLRRRGRHASRGVAREMDAKWRAIAARVPGGWLKGNAYRDVLTEGKPEMRAALFD
jgi:hypothetical protein